jgi:uncharacterized protein YciI
MTRRALERYELVLLRRPVPASEYDDATLERIQAEHLAHYDGLRERGLVVAFGPVLDQPDELLRGIAVFAVGTVDEARALAEGDPAVVAGRLEVEAMTFLTAPGGLGVPGIPIVLGG